MNCKYRVTLTGIKGFFRVYHINGKNTLYTFHKQLRDDLEFPIDQPILFKGLDAEGKVVQRWALVELGAGTVDTVSIQDTVKSGVTNFVYFYDIASKKSVNITYEGEVDDSVEMPVLIETKGPVPLEFENGYVSFEDMPDDCRRVPSRIPASGKAAGENDEDDDEEDDEDGGEDREEEEIIYSENE